MAIARLSIADLEDTVRQRLLDGRPQDVREIAEATFRSKSSLQRELKVHGTSFTEVRQRVRVEYALELLTEGKTVSRTAAEVGMSQSHLSKAIKDKVGLTAGQIRRAWILADTARSWRAGVPPRFGTKLYWRRLEGWRRLERELDALMSAVPADSPLRSWANLVIAQAERPDFRTGPYRARVWGERQRERDYLRQALEQTFQFRVQQAAGATMRLSGVRR